MPARTSQLARELAELVALPAIAGEESAVAAWLVDRLQHAGRKPTIDTLGNVVLRAPGRSASLLFTAHMDQVGFMVSRVSSDQALCSAVGSPDGERDAETPARIDGERHPRLAGTITEQEEGSAILRTGELDRVSVGDSVVWEAPGELGTGPIVRAPALDNRIGCLLALHAALHAGPSANAAWAWTVREETEQSGAVRVARDLEPAAVVALDVTSATDPAGAASPIVRGGGPVITLLDEGMSADRGLLRRFTAGAAAAGVAWQPEVVESGMSEAGAVLRALGIPSLALLVAIEHPHTARETADLRDLQAAIELLRSTLARVA